MRNNLLLIILLLIIGTSCINRPKGVLSDKKMAPVVADLELAESYIETLPYNKRTEARDELVSYVIEKHGLTREEFDSTMSWYGHNSDAYYELCNLVEKELRNRRRQIDGNSVTEIETSNLWPYPKQALLSGLTSDQGFDFSLPVADVEKGQILNLKFKVNNSISANTLLGVEYLSGAKAYLSRNIRDSKHFDISLQTDSSQSVSRIFGYILLNDTQKLPLWVDSISLKALPFDSLEYYKINSQRLTY